MAGSVNKVIIVGNLGKDPEIRTFQNGGRVAAFSVATSERWTDKSTGEKRERVEWHRVSILNEALVGIVEKYLRKGSKVYLEGQLETRKWSDKDGVEKFSTEVVLRPYRGEIVLLDALKKDQADTAAATAHSPPQSGSAAAEIDDSIPF